MALDTAEKRRAASGIMLPLLPGVTPKAQKDVEWRREVAGSYPFNLAGAPRILRNNPMIVTLGRMMNR